MDEKEEEPPLFSDQETSALGLRLKKTPSFVNFLQTELSQTTQTLNNANPLPLSYAAAENHAPNSNSDFMSQPMSEKLKASNFPATVLRIGTFERVSRHESDLVAKLYYAKRKLVWEFLEGPLKKKIEIQWSDIGAMRAIIGDDQPGVWEIELNQPPLFFHETNPQPRKHTLWQPVGDFTNGQASRIRRHFVRFPRGVLDKHYEKLLQCDKRLHMLSLKPFPTQNPNIFFHQNSDLCLDFQLHAKPNLLFLTQPNPYLPFPSHMIAQNNCLLQTATMLPPNTTNNVVNVFNQPQPQPQPQSSFSALPVLQSNTHEYNPINNYLENHLVVNHDIQLPAYNNSMVNNDPNIISNFYHYDPQNISNNGPAMESHVTQSCLDVGGGGTLYSPWVPSHPINANRDHSHFINGDHSSCSSANSGSPSGFYPNQDQDWA